jgi:hypothetical protein
VTLEHAPSPNCSCEECGSIIASAALVLARAWNEGRRAAGAAREREWTPEDAHGMVTSAFKLLPFDEAEYARGCECRQCSARRCLENAIGMLDHVCAKKGR